MKRLVFFLSICLCCSGLLFADSGEIPWIMDYQQSIDAAGDSGTDLFVLITAPDWCGPCQYMEASTFTDYRVITEISKNFIPLKVLDNKNGGWNTDQNYFDFDGYPTYLIMNKEGDVRFQDSGAVDPDTLLEYIQPYLSGGNNTYSDSGNGYSYGEEEPSYGNQTSGNKKELIGYFPFTDSMDDFTSQGSYITPYKYAPEYEILFSDGEYSTDYGEYFSMHPAELEYGNFTVGLYFYSTYLDNGMNIITAGNYSRWLSVKYRENEIQLTLNNHELVYPTGITELDLYEWHSLICSVDLENDRAMIIVDDQLAEIPLPPNFQFDIYKRELFPDKAFFLCDFSNGDTFHGYIDDLFVFNRALDDDELIDTQYYGLYSLLEFSDEEHGNSGDSGAVSLEITPDMFKGKPDGSELLSPMNALFEDEILELVNSERARIGLQSLIWNEELANSARYHAADMATDNYLDHDTLDRNSSDEPEVIVGSEDRFNAFFTVSDYSMVTENIAAGVAEANECMEKWMNSPIHRKKMLSEDARYIGIGYWENPDSAFHTYCVQVIGY